MRWNRFQSHLSRVETLPDQGPEIMVPAQGHTDPGGTMEDRQDTAERRLHRTDDPDDAFVADNPHALADAIR